MAITIHWHYFRQTDSKFMLLILLIIHRMKIISSLSANNLSVIVVGVMHLSSELYIRFPWSTSSIGCVHRLEIDGCVVPVGSGARSCVKMKGDVPRCEKWEKLPRLDNRSLWYPKRRKLQRALFARGNSISLIRATIEIRDFDYSRNFSTLLLFYRNP